ncbi:MAG: DUF4157 domain-containing protein [Coleofasciculus sp. C1-SOL-03]|uniref:eCIS core domain-containing protein n=1 Tax=Coleofasciculus sp. C1-SOL-03 TaxID=3069522 RepID=UPI0032FB4ACB
MEYKPVQKKNSSWTPTTVQKKGKSPSKLGHFSIQPKSNPSSAPSQEIGEYSRASADRLTANVMRGIQAKEQEQAEGLTLSEVEGSTLQRKSESPWAPTFDAAPPITQSPASQLSRDVACNVSTFAPVSENPIQRQCADCAKEENEQAGEAGKDLEEIGIQTKLTIGAPGDTYEQEADLVETLHATSLQVMSTSAPPDSSASVQRQLDTNHPHHPHQIWQRAQSITPVVQRQIDPRVEMGQMIQRAAQIDGNQASGDLESRLSASKGGGSPLSEDVRGFMEPRFGADFSGVRVHTGGEAVQMNQELGAQAFTHGSDVYFGAGKEPGNNELMAHELTHVVQQGGGVQTKVQSPETETGHVMRQSASQKILSITNFASHNQTIRRFPATQGGVGGKFSSPKWPLGKRTFGPLMGTANLLLEISVEAIQGAAPDSGQSQTKVTSPITNFANGQVPTPVGPGGGSTKVLVGPVGNAENGAIGIGAEAKYEIEQGVRSKILGWQPSIKGGGELTTKEAKFGVAVSVDTDVGSVPITMAPLEFNIVKWERGGKPQFAVCTTSAEFQLAAFQHTTSDGNTYKVEAKPKLEFEFEPNPVYIGKWVARNLGKVIATQVGLTSSIIAAGVLTIGFGLYQIATSGEITERTEFAVKKCKNYCKSAQNVIQGKEPITEAGGPEGAAAARKILAGLNQKFPPELVTAEAKKLPIYTNAWGVAWPLIKQKAIADYWDDHKFEHFVYGDKGAGNGGFRTFKRVLDAVGDR